MTTEIEIKVAKLIDDIDILLNSYSLVTSVYHLNSIYTNLPNDSIFKRWCQSLNYIELPASSNCLMQNMSTDTNESSLVSIDCDDPDPHSSINSFDNIQNDIIHQTVNNIAHDDFDLNCNNQQYLIENQKTNINITQSSYQLKEFNPFDIIDEEQTDLQNDSVSQQDIEDSSISASHQDMNNNSNIQDSNTIYPLPFSLKDNFEEDIHKKNLFNTSETISTDVSKQIKLEGNNNSNDTNNRISKNKRKKNSAKRLSQTKQKKRKASDIDKEADDEWIGMYLQLLEYESIHKSYDVPLEYNVENDEGEIVSLGIWYNFQKECYQEYQHDDHTKQWYDLIKDKIINNPIIDPNSHSDTTTSSVQIPKIDFTCDHTIQVKSEILESNDSNPSINHSIKIEDSNKIINSNDHKQNKFDDITATNDIETTYNNDNHNTTTAYSNNTTTNNNNNEEHYVENENNSLNIKIPSYVAYTRYMGVERYDLNIGYVIEKTNNGDLIVFELKRNDYDKPYESLYIIDSSIRIEVIHNSIAIHDLLFENIPNNISESDVYKSRLKLTIQAIESIQKFKRRFEPLVSF